LSEPAKQFLNSLQALRFVAALMVLVSHLGLELERRPFPARLPFHDPTGINWAVGVDVFFIVSGFIMYYLSARRFGERGYVGRFLRRRLVRVVPLYWIFTTFFLCIALAAPGVISHTDLGISRVLTSYLFIPWPRADGGMYPILALGWTLNYEMFFYLVFAVGLLLPRPRGLALILGVFGALVVVGLLVSGQHFILRFFTRPIILEFGFGMLLAMAYLRGIRLGPGVRVALALLGIALLVVCGSANWTVPAWRPIWAGLPCSLIASAGVLGERDLRGDTPYGRLLVLGGDCSYSLYLSHMYATRALSVVWQRFQLEGGWVFFSVGMVGCLALAFVSYATIERPLLALLRRSSPPRFGAAPVGIRDPNVS
jgi:exopolysaccharide production protein ExoZ